MVPRGDLGYDCAMAWIGAWRVKIKMPGQAGPTPMGTVFRSPEGEHHFYTDEGRRFAIEEGQAKPEVGSSMPAAGFECQAVSVLYDDPAHPVSFSTTLGYASRRLGAGGVL